MNDVLGDTDGTTVTYTPATATESAILTLNGAVITASAADKEIDPTMYSKEYNRYAGICAKDEALTGANPFEDVQVGKYYENAIIWAAQSKIVEGYGNGKFGPDDDITRDKWRPSCISSARIM